MLREIQNQYSEPHPKPCLLFPRHRFNRVEVLKYLKRFIIKDSFLTIGLRDIHLYDQIQASLLSDLIHARGDFSAFANKFRLLASAPSSLLDQEIPSCLDPELIERIATLTLRIPSLVDLREDIPLLARSIVAEAGVPQTLLADDVDSWLETSDWPGDYKQLRRVLLVAIAASGGSPISRDILESAKILESKLPEDAYEPDVVVTDLPESRQTGASPRQKITPLASDFPHPIRVNSDEPTDLSLSSARPTTSAHPIVATAQTTPLETPTPRPKRRVGAYNFSSRLASSLEDAKSVPPPSVETHPRFKAA